MNVYNLVHFTIRNPHAFKEAIKEVALERKRAKEMPLRIAKVVAEYKTKGFVSGSGTLIG